MHLLAKFGDLSFNPSKVIVRTSPFCADFDFLTPNNLEGQGQITAYPIPTENSPKYTWKPNLVILAPFGQKLSHVYGRTDGQTDRRTDAGDDNTPRPYWPRGNDLEDQSQSTPFLIGFWKVP